VVGALEASQDQAHRAFDADQRELSGRELGQPDLLDEAARGRVVEVANAD